MRITEIEYKILALFLSTVTYAVYFKSFGVTVCYALYHIVDKGTGKSVKRTVVFVVGRTGNDYFIALKRNVYFAVKGVFKSTLGSLYGYLAAVYLNIYTGRNRDRLLSYS